MEYVKNVMILVKRVTQEPAVSTVMEHNLDKLLELSHYANALMVK
jgi:hypothetical protein